MPFLRKDGSLFADEVALTEIASQVGTPCYVYTWHDVESRYRELESAFDSTNVRIRYAVKANSNLTILRRMAALGAGFDVVSGGELERVIRAGGDPTSVVFSGVGKTVQEISFGLKAGIACFNVESESETRRIAAIAEQLGMVGKVAIRVNPDIDVQTHPYIATGMRENKFGLPEDEAFTLACKVAKSMPNLEMCGIACHIGSQLTDLEPYAASLDSMLKLQSRMRQEGVPCASIDFGGGFGIRYRDEQPLSFKALGELLKTRDFGDTTLDVEPGRSLIGAAGVLLTRVEYLKPAMSEGYRNFCVVDAAMNDLIRPALYEAYHDVENVEPVGGERRQWNIVGPICETGDFLANNRAMAIQEGDLLAVRDVGAYGFVMSSNYNTRLRPPEVMVESNSWTLIRRRESLHDLLHLEMS